MRLHHTQTVTATPEAMYAAFTDLTRVGQCFPGAVVSSVTGNDFVGGITARIGPLVLTYDGRGTVTHADPKTRTAAIEASGGERHGLGKADIRVRVTLKPAGEKSTTVDLKTDLTFKGAPNSLGQSVVQRASDPLVKRFLDCLADPTCGGTPGVDDKPLDVGREVLPGLVASYGRSILGRLGRR